MRRTNLHFWLLIIACYLFIPTAAKAQSTYGYSSVYYDPASNTITAYAETDPDYSTQTYYYNSYVQANIHDPNGNVIAHLASQTGNPSVSFSGNGNGSSSYDIVSGHYMLLFYSQHNFYSQCNSQYYSYAYYDYYNYQHFAESPTPDATFSLYLFFASGPVCATPSPNITLGSSTDSDAEPPPPTAHPVNFHQTSVTPQSDGTLHFQYAWGSSTGNLADLSNCSVGEYVTYPGNGSTYIYPAPMVHQSPNPTTSDEPATTGGFPDDHYPPESFSHPLKAANFTATQKYRYRCGGGSYFNLTGYLSIKRTVSQNANGSWKYTVTKSGSSATINPIP
jgi:hypothetical protein